MRLFYDTVSTPLLSILRKIMNSEVFKDFRLVGGTALALQRGHRRSVDIDMFTDLDYAEMPVAAMRDYLEKEVIMSFSAKDKSLPSRLTSSILSHSFFRPLKKMVYGLPTKEKLQL